MGNKARPPRLDRPAMSMMTSKEVAKFLTLSLRTVRGMEADGKLPPRVQVSARRLAYRREDIEAYVENNGERQ